MSSFPTQSAKFWGNDLEAALKRQKVSESKFRPVESEEYIPELAFLMKRKTIEPLAITQRAAEKPAERSAPEAREWKYLQITPSTSLNVPAYKSTGSSHLSMYPISSLFPTHIGILHRAKWVDEFYSTFDKVKL